MKAWAQDIRLWMLIALALRLFRIGAGDYWYDEAFAALVVRQDFRTMILALAGDVHPPLWYTLMWGWLRFTGGEVVHEGLMRLPNLVFSLGSLYLAWRIAASRSPSWLKWGIAAWMTFSPAQIHYAQEFRMYALFELEFLAALWFFLQGRDRWAAFFAATMMWTHYYGLFYTATLMFMVMWKRRSLWPYAWAVVSFAPWVAVLWAQMNIIEGNYWIQPLHPGDLIYTLIIITLGWSLTEWIRVIAAALIPGTLIYAFIHRNRKEMTFWTWLLIPSTMAGLVSIVWQPVWLHRGFLPLSPVLAMVVLESWRKRDVRLFFGTIWGSLLALLVGLYYVGYWNGRSDFSLWIAPLIEDNWEGEPWLLTSDGLMVGLQLYHPEIPAYRIITCKNPPGYLSWITKAALFPKPIDFEMALDKWERFWLVHDRFPFTPKCEAQQIEKWTEMATREISMGKHKLGWTKAWLITEGP